MSKLYLVTSVLVFFSSLGVATAQDYYAILIGVETYDTSFFKNLQYAGDDAMGLGKQLKGLGFKTTIMTSESDSAQLRPTTPEKIMALIESVGRSCQAGDTLVIALSGHGVQFSDEQVLPSGVRETYFCPSDANLGKRNTLLAISSVINVMNETQATRKLLLVDACQEQVLSQEGQKKSRTVIDLGSVHEKRRNVPGGLAILFSCKDKQFSWEHDPLQHSVFTYHVIQYLRGAAQPRYYDEGKLELNGLVSYVQKHTNDYVIQQNLTNDGQYPVLAGNTTNWTFGRLLQLPLRFKNSLDMEFALIGAGSFQMGSRLSPQEIHQRYPGGEVSYYEDETLHSVEITGERYMGKHEVTVGQFRRFVEAENYQTDAERDGQGGFGYDAEAGNFVQNVKYTWRNPGFQQSDSHPVVNVSWNDAVAFCRWLSRVEGQEYRLPTEAEWEYCCRAGSLSEFSFGDVADQLVLHGNVADATLKAKFPGEMAVSTSDGSLFTSRVGSYRENAFGLYDMHGNVAEWCADWYGKYELGTVVDPKGPVTGWLRVSRGGSWFNSAWGCRSALRNGNRPDYRDFILGFRVALVPSRK